MNNVKVKGVLDENGIKNFMITNTDTGEVHVAMREGQFSFRVGEFVGTLKQCKQLVSASKVVHFADAKPECDSGTTSPDAYGCERVGTWECVDPCALLILADSGDPDSAHCKEIDRTLAAYGWITPDGHRDIESAKKWFSRWSAK